MSWLLVCSLLLAPQLADTNDASAPHASVRLIDVTGDGLLDELHLGHDGTVSVSVNVGSKTFLAIEQHLPKVSPAGPIPSGSMSR